jgi:hypothetical protein
VIVVIPKILVSFLGLTRKFISGRLDAMGWKIHPMTKADIIGMQPFGQTLVEMFLPRATRRRQEYQVRVPIPVIHPLQDVGEDEQPPGEE